MTKRATRFAWALTLLYLAGIVLFPLYLSRLQCLPGLTHATPMPLLARNWLACHWPEPRLDIGAYGEWLTGTLLIPVLFWARRTWAEQQAIAAAQRKTLFLATLRQQQERFEILARRIEGTLHQSFATAGEESRSEDPIEDANVLIQRLLRAQGVEVKAALRRSAAVEEYVAEANTHLASLKRFDLASYSGGPWRDLLHTLERLLPAGA